MWNNDGRLSIRATQCRFFNSRFIGTDSTCGLSLPNTEKIANAYGIKCLRADRSETLAAAIKEAIAYPGPVICEVMRIRDQEIIPIVSSFTKPDSTITSRPMAGMYPFMDREEAREYDNTAT